MTNFFERIIQSPLFEGVSDDAMSVIKPEMLQDFPDGRVIFRQGQLACALTVIGHGCVRVEADGILVAMRGVGQVVGEQAFIGEHSHTATAIAQGYVRALCLSCEAVQRLMADAVFNRNLLRVLSTKLREATADRAVRYAIQQRLFSEFEAHTSPDITQRLLRSGHDYGRPRFINAIVLMSDIRSFTDRSATLQPDEIAAQLSPYLDAVVDVVHQYSGMVDKFIGDAVLAVWGYEQESENEFNPKSAAQALLCAKQMLATAEQFNFAGQPIRIGVGLNAGRVFIGNIGGDGKRQFTVLGTPVNLTARFESETKNLSSIVVGPDFYKQLSAKDAMSFVAHPEYPIKGAKPMTIYSHQFNPGEKS